MTLTESQTEKLRSLFKAGLRFEIPPYQRKYSWRAEQAQELWDDISNSYKMKEDHFMGTLSLLEVPGTGIQTQEVYEIIDGQQRITTLYLLLKVLVDRISKSKQDELKKILIGDSDRPKIKLLGADEAWMNSFIFNSPDIIPEKRSQQNILEVYKYFQDVTSSYDSEKIEDIIAFMQLRLSFLIFKVESQGQAIKMFSSINDRGLPLKTLDKVKSILMLYDHLCLKEGLKEEINDSFEVIFDSYDKIFTNKDTLGVGGRGVLGTLDEDTVFSHHYITARRLFPDWDKKNPSPKTIFQQIKRCCEQGRDKPEELKCFISGYINDFKDFVVAYSNLIGSIEQDVDYDEAFRYLEFSGTLYPLVVRLYMKGKLNQFFHILKTIEIRVYKLRGTNPTADIYNLSSDVCDEIELDAINKGLIRFCEDYGGDIYIKNKLAEPAYSNSATKYILYSYSGDKLKFSDYAKLEKDHIFPKQGSFDIAHYGFEESTFEYEKDKIGNITLLESSKNSSASTKTPSDKKHIYLDSVVEDTKKLGSSIDAKQDNFNKQDIDTRGTDIIEFCINKFRIGS